MAVEQVKELLQHYRLDDPVSGDDQHLLLSPQSFQGVRALSCGVGGAQLLGLVGIQDVFVLLADGLDHLSGHCPHDDDVLLYPASLVHVQSAIDRWLSVNGKAYLVPVGRAHARSSAAGEDDRKFGCARAHGRPFGRWPYMINRSFPSCDWFCMAPQTNVSRSS